ncbi:MAG: helix-turn-helix domain-containing protein [Bacteroides sp.]|nr:helix-turn-helix domain-containing protein [Bacteroides sp.]
MICGENTYKVIVKLCEDRGLSVSKLAKICGMNKRSIYNIKYFVKVKITTILKICQGLEISTQEFFNNPIFAEPMA